MEAPSGPLSDIRVIELGQLIAGPFCGQLLGDLGAEVIKVEQPGTGDPMRRWGKLDAAGNSLTWPVIGRNKKSVTLDLRSSRGQELAQSLIGSADILIENFRPGTLERWNLAPERLFQDNPGLIVVRVSGYGQDGPYANRAGFGSIGEAMGGLRYLVGEADRPPARMGVSMGDSLAGTFAALGALSALHARQATGRGQVVDSAIYEAVLAFTESELTEWDVLRHQRGRTGAILPGVAPSNVYPTAAGGAVLIAANQDTVFRRLAGVMNSPELADDCRFATHQARGENQEELDALIGKWSSGYSTRQAFRREKFTAPRTCSPTSTSPPGRRSCAPRMLLAGATPCRTSSRGYPPLRARCGGRVRDWASTPTRSWDNSG
jgi:succinyl-CoA---D-citramalate CoA-transferase